MIAACPLDGYHAQIAAGAKAPFERLAEIRRPVRLINGTEDRTSWPVVAEVLARQIPDAACTLLPGGLHFGNLDDPATFNPALRAALADIEATAF
jgi:pimeloyl-ACP methyl ester carboxylesterase